MDLLSQSVITVGGIGTIVAVSMVGLFLVWVVAPLFLSPRWEESAVASSVHRDTGQPAYWGVDEYGVLRWAVFPDGGFELIRLHDGGRVYSKSLAPNRTPTACSYANQTGILLLGFEDGWVQSYELRWRTSYPEASELPPALAGLATGAAAAWEDGVIERVSEGAFRFQRLEVSEAVGIAASTGPVLALDQTGELANLKAVVWTQGSEGGSEYVLLRGGRDFLTQKATLRRQVLSVPAPDTAPDYLRLNDLGDLLFAVWSDGHAIRYRLEGEGAPMLAEQLDLLEAPERRVTALDWLIGGTTLLVGDDAGRVFGWFSVRPEGVEPGLDDVGPDGMRTVRAKDFGAEVGKPVRVLASAQRSRLFLAGHEGGLVRVVYAVSETQLGRLEGFLAPDESMLGAVFTPQGDGIYIWGRDRLHHWRMDEAYPEASLRSLFLPVWYEGYTKPEYMWQSSSASDDSEPKLSMVPLIFGTMKATLYSMLFGAPIALLAAIFTSEFLAPRAKARIKPVIELMASLPSVVLGFLAALVFAPVIEQAVMAVLVMFLLIPLLFVFAGLIWQLLPHRLTVGWANWRLLPMLLILPLGVWLSSRWGPLMEQWLFGGDFKMWLNGRHTVPVVGSAFGGLWFVLMPITLLGLVLILSRTWEVRARVWVQGMSRRGAAFWALSKSGMIVLFALLLSALIAFLLSMAGVDVREPLPGWGALMDTYDQRNALVVGFVMGFAIIPIIYTLAEDALSTVPSHLRSASLGAGATQWQTTTRIIIPTAMSGLFSALMIGLGRAVGETMIVLMALGNTPVMNINLFEGARTLSANIAVELPEAVRNSAHYRTLFLSALALFLLTFVVNTLAETVRIRFRKRAYQL